MMRMRLTERVREFIPKEGCHMLNKRFVILRDEEVGGLVTTDVHKLGYKQTRRTCTY